MTSFGPYQLHTFAAPQSNTFGFPNPASKQPKKKTPNTSSSNTSNKTNSKNAEEGDDLAARMDEEAAGVLVATEVGAEVVGTVAGAVADAITAEEAAMAVDFELAVEEKGEVEDALQEEEEDDRPTELHPISDSN